MRHVLLRLITGYAVVALTAIPASASELTPPGRLLSLYNGVTPITLAPHVKGFLVYARHPVGTAHGFGVLTAYVNIGVDDPQNYDSGLYIIPFVDQHFGNEQLYLLNQGGADCEVTDLRLIRTSNGAVEVIMGERKFGNSWADTEPVTFDYYALTPERPPELAPPYSFKLMKTFTTKKPYCDVEDAFRAELGL